MDTDAARARLKRLREPEALRILIFLGTRPEAVKIAPIVLAARRADDVRIRLVSSGQHPRGMLEVFDEFAIQPDADLTLFHPGQTLAEILANAVRGCTDQITAWEPDVVLVQGDTTSALAGAMAAFYAGVPSAHVEAGLRTDDLLQPFPEEMNRRVIDTFAEYLFPPTPAAAANVAREVFRGADIFVTGNTVVDAALRVADRTTLPEVHDDSFDPWTMTDGHEGRVLVTVHRRESWGADLDAIAVGLARAASRFPKHLFLVPLHPNPIVRGSFGRPLPPNIVIGDPLPYVPFMRVLSHSDLVVTDSGGVLEEATSLGKPALVVRERTERLEAVEAGMARIIGVETSAIERAICETLSDPQRTVEPASVFGDGHAGSRIVQWLRWRYGLAAHAPQPFTPGTNVQTIDLAAAERRSEDAPRRISRA